MVMQIVAHSVGCWVAYEFLVLARSKGLRMPEKVFLSAMAAPSIATAERPWRQQHHLTESEFKASYLHRSAPSFTELAKVANGLAIKACMLPTIVKPADTWA